ncbi:MAG: tetratricopeptide repeat protein [Pseudomonadota bacterium]
MTDKTFFTATMAKVQEDQGNFDKAEEICRHLLENDPDNEECQFALNRIANRRTGASIERLAPLFREWIDLMLEYKKIRSLRKLRDGMA